MKIAITGGAGFLGWHTAVRLRAVHGIHATCLGRREFADSSVLQDGLYDIDVVVHLAGVNRAESDAAVEAGNTEIARSLAGALVDVNQPIHVVYANSIQSSGDSPYGRGKAQAASILRSAVEKCGGTFADVVLPNLFGEHGRPHYNSFVATFCHEVTRGGSPEVIEDNEVPLLHAQRAAASLVESALRREEHTVAPEAEPRRVSEILDRIRGFHEVYRHGQIPQLHDFFTVDLFNTYRSYMFPSHFPFASQVNSDERGELFETVRVHGGSGQTFVSTTRSEAVRGEHYHLRKVERFFVLSGTAEIALRRVFDDEIVRFRIAGTDHCFVDMPTLWVHNIRNVGDDELVTMFWTDQLLDPEAPDTYRESVEAPPEQVGQ